MAQLTFFALEKQAVPAEPPCRIYPPTACFTRFGSDEDRRARLVSWKLQSEKAKTVKDAFLYKDLESPAPITCRIAGYEPPATAGREPFIAVIELLGGHLTCIHAAYLKQMQQKDFDPRRTAVEEEEEA